MLKKKLIETVAGLRDKKCHALFYAAVEDMPLHGEFFSDFAESGREIILGEALLPYKDNTAEKHSDIRGSVLRKVQDVSPVGCNAICDVCYDATLVRARNSKNIRTHGKDYTQLVAQCQTGT